ncbi:MAG: hypothetical protein ACOCTG_04770, partial [Bacteroidota bacterium]
VPPERAEEAASILESEPFTDEELDQAALSANPDVPSAHDAKRETMLDSGGEELHLSPPEEEEDDEATTG